VAHFGQAQVDASPASSQFPSLAPANLTITNTAGVIALRLACPTDPGENHAYRVACQAGNLHTHFPFVYCGAAATFSAFGNQPDRHGENTIIRGSAPLSQGRENCRDFRT